MKRHPNPGTTHLHLPRKAQRVLNQGHQWEVHSGKLRVKVLATQEQEERPGCHLPLHNGAGDHPGSQDVKVGRLWKEAEERKGAS